MTGDSDSSASAKQARSITYKHDGDKYVVTVGKPRKHYARKTGPRGGYIKDADWQGWGQETGSNVTRITVGDDLILVESEEPSRGWANPSFVGRNEIMKIEWAGELTAFGEDSE